MLIVQKFGGSSVADAARVANVAKLVTDTYKKGNSVVVVVSAQGDTTDDLIEKAHEINPRGSKREMDMLLAAGEQISIALLAMAIEKIGCPVVSLLGWQAGFRTNSTYSAARIRKVEANRIHAGAWRFGYQRGRDCRVDESRSVPDLHRCGGRVHRRSAQGAGGT